MTTLSSRNESENTKSKNQQKLPLDKIYVNVYNRYGMTEVKAIDPYWIGDYTYPKYYPIPNELSLENIHKWIFKNTSYLKALKLFYNMSYQEFWSHVVYEPALPIVLESFLEGAVPPYLPQPEHDDIISLYSEIYSLVFAIYKKLLTDKQSETEYMAPSTIGAFLYDNSVIKIETLVSLIRIYGYSDDGPLIELLQKAFNLMPVLCDHLKLCSNHFYDIFESISAEAYEYDSANIETTTKLALLLYDTVFCLRMFMKLYPDLINICLENEFFSKIVHTYEEEIPLIEQLISMIIIDKYSISKQHVVNAKLEILEICNMMLNTCFDLLLQSQDIKWLTIYLESVNVIALHKNFAIRYNSKYTFYSQLETLGMIFPDYMQSHASYEDMLYIFKPCDDNDEPGPSNIDTNEESDENDSSDIDDDDYNLSKKNIILDTKIQEILEVFPYYGEGYIEKCLRYYGMDTQRVIDGLLSVEGLPEELAQIDISLPRIPPEEESKQPKPIMEYKGKKPDKHKDINELLNDKSYIKEQKERYEQYRNDETWYDSLYNDDHDSDEYEYNVPLYEGGDILDSLPKKRIMNSDDENKENKSGKDQKFNSKIQSIQKGKNSSQNKSDGRSDNRPGSSQGSSDSKNKKNISGRTEFVRNNPNVQNGDVSEESDESEEESSLASGVQKPRNAFCEDPAVIRARREAHYQNKQRTNNRKPRDVVGNAKGQGQEKDVLVSRDKKNKNKSTSANHNRRAGAQWKRSRGMFPS